MADKALSPENALLKTVFKARAWDIYSRRLQFLSATDQDSWESVDFPLEISLELTNSCNLRCIMCPVPNLKRERGFMDEPVFRKAVEEISHESGFLFLPQGFGEALLHPKWADFLSVAHSAGVSPVVVLTNGMLLAGKNLDAARRLTDVLIVTLDGSTAKTYESVRVNSSFEKVTGNIENVLKLRDAQKPHMVLRIIRMRDNDAEIESFRNFWERKISKGDVLQVSDCIDWAGSVAYRGVHANKMNKARHACRMLWKNLTVFHDGRVSPCCFDAEGELSVGHVLQQGLRDIWNGQPLRNLRDLHRKGHFHKIPLCAQCGNWL